MTELKTFNQKSRPYFCDTGCHGWMDGKLDVINIKYDNVMSEITYEGNIRTYLMCTVH